MPQLVGDVCISSATFYWDLWSVAIETREGGRGRGWRRVRCRHHQIMQDN